MSTFYFSKEEKVIPLWIFEYFVCLSFNHLFNTELTNAFHGPDIPLGSKDTKFHHPLRVHILVRREAISNYVTNMLSSNKSYIEEIKTKERLSAQEKLIHRVTFDIERTNVSWYHLSRDLNEVAEGTASFAKALRWGAPTAY